MISLQQICDCAADEDDVMLNCWLW